MSHVRYFKLSEANAQLRQLTARFNTIMQLRWLLKSIDNRLYTKGFAAATLLPQDNIKRDQLVSYGLGEVLKKELQQVRAMGCVIQDLDQGLVDWPSLHQGTEIRLSWQYGEGEILYWQHPKSDQKRRPISELALA